MTTLNQKKSTIAIIGAGQAGLQLACGLLKKGYVVNIFSNRTPEQIYQGSILSSQGMFDSALNFERELSLNFWDGVCPKNIAVTMTLVNPNPLQKAIEWTGITQKPYQSIDQRLKFSYWMQHLQDFGGKLIIQDVDLITLDKIASEHDLTIVASGKGEISSVFIRNAERSNFSSPQRMLACLYVTNILPSAYPGVQANIIPEIGEYFTVPGLTLNDNCEMMLFEGIPGSTFDCWNNIITPTQQLSKALELLKEYVPWEFERCKNAVLTDSKAVLTGGYTPIVKHPTSQLPCGKFVLGIADAVVLNDPIAGQGANNAAKAAAIYLREIIKNEDNLFDDTWMRQTFECYWEECAQWSTAWTNLLLQPPAPHVIELFKIASQYPELANKFANGFDNPATLFPWINHPEAAEKMIKTIQDNHSLR